MAGIDAGMTNPVTGQLQLSDTTYYCSAEVPVTVVVPAHHWRPTWCVDSMMPHHCCSGCLAPQEVGSEAHLAS
jgi:hypothetical protein